MIFVMIENYYSYTSPISQDSILLFRQCLLVHYYSAIPFYIGEGILECVCVCQYNFQKTKDSEKSEKLQLQFRYAIWQFEIDYPDIWYGDLYKMSPINLKGHTYRVNVMQIHLPLNFLQSKPQSILSTFYQSTQGTRQWQSNIWYGMQFNYSRSCCALQIRSRSPKCMPQAIFLSLEYVHELSKYNLSCYFLVIGNRKLSVLLCTIRWVGYLHVKFRFEALYMKYGEMSTWVYTRITMALILMQCSECNPSRLNLLFKTY